MPQRSLVTGLRRRTLLLAAASAPLSAHAATVCTPHELGLRYRARVEHALAVPRNEGLIYASLAEAELAAHPDAEQGAPQYLLVVDSCPAIQVAFLFWRLLPGHYRLVGAAPASTGDPMRDGCVATPCGVFPQSDARGSGALAARVYDFGLQRVRLPEGRGLRPVHLQAHAAMGASGARLGNAQSDGRVLLSPSLVAFLDEYGVLDASRGEGRTPAGETLPFAGRYLVVLDSEREERPEWASA